MKHVLCVDDDPFMRELYAIAITGPVELAETAEDAMPRVADARAIVVDLGLPGMSGAELVSWIRARSDAPILVVTGEESVQIEGVSVMVKPLRVPELRAWLASVD